MSGWNAMTPNWYLHVILAVATTLGNINNERLLLGLLAHVEVSNFSIFGQY